MKKTLLFIATLVIWLIIPNDGMTQDKVNSKWSIGFTVGPQFTNISSPDIATSTIGKVGYMAGAFGGYNISDDLKVRVGINYDKRSFNVNFHSIYFFLNDSVISNDSYSAFDIFYSLDYLTIPLSFIYTKGEGKIKLLVQGSIFYSLFLKAHQSGFTDIFIAEDDFQYINQEDFPNIKSGHNHDDYSGTTDSFFKTEPFNTSDFGINLFIGVIYNLSEKVGIYLSPGFTADFGKVLENPVYESKWVHIFKIESGIVINLK